MLQNPIFKDHNATFCDIITCMQAFSHLHILIARSVTYYGHLQSFIVNYLFKPMVNMLLFVIFFVFRLCYIWYVEAYGNTVGQLMHLRTWDMLSKEKVLWPFYILFFYSIFISYIVLMYYQIFELKEMF